MTDRCTCLILSPAFAPPAFASSRISAASRPCFHPDAPSSCRTTPRRMEPPSELQATPYTSDPKRYGRHQSDIRGRLRVRSCEASSWRQGRILQAAWTGSESAPRGASRSPDPRPAGCGCGPLRGTASGLTRWRGCGSDSGSPVWLRLRPAPPGSGTMQIYRGTIWSWRSWSGSLGAAAKDCGLWRAWHER